MSRSWTRHSTTRRRFLAGATLSTAAGTAAFLAACSSSNNNSNAATAARGTVQSAGSATGGSPQPAASRAAASPQAAGSPQAAAQQVKRGGTYRLTSTPPSSLDPYVNSTYTTKLPASYVYSTLLMIEPSRPTPTGGVTPKVSPDNAASYEVSPDGLKYTVKLNPNAKFHPPVNRALSADDVVFSWQRFNGKVPGSTPAPNASQIAVVDSVQAIDAATVSFTLNRPYASFPLLLADPALLLLMPKETGTAFDPAKTMVGTGPFLFDSYTTGSSIAYKRNPAWHFGPDRPYLDRVEATITSQQDVVLNQFLSGNFDQIAVSGTNIKDIKSRIPNVQTLLGDLAGTNYLTTWAFERVSEPRANAPWTDVRVRRAMSMALDQRSIADGLYNYSDFTSAGITVPIGNPGALPYEFGDLKVDPTTLPNVGQYFKFDAKAAKALLDQAGGGFSTEVHMPAGLGQVYTDVATLAIKYWKDIGIDVKLVLDDYNATYIPKTYKGDFTGLAHGAVVNINDPMIYLQTQYSKDSALNQGHVRDDNLDQMMNKYFTELDATKRNQLVKDVQAAAFDPMYYIPSIQSGSIPSLTGFQPNVRNFADHVSAGPASQPIILSFVWKA